jgi:hypothetical protein
MIRGGNKTVSIPFTLSIGFMSLNIKNEGLESGKVFSFPFLQSQFFKYGRP